MTERIDPPAGWCRATSEQICAAIVDCLHTTAKFGTGDFACLDTNAMGPGYIKHGSVRYVSESIFNDRNRRLVPTPGDVVFAREGSVGDAVLLPESPLFCLGQRTMLLRPESSMNGRFLMLALMSPGIKRQYEEKVTGSTVAHINMADIRRLVFSVPPLNEQKRIVAKIDALQTRSDAAREALDAIGPLLEKFRQSVLAAAFRGDLTKKWRESHPDTEPACKLLERIRAERRRRWEEANPRKKYVEPEPVDTEGLPDLPEGWCWARISDVGQADLGRQRAPSNHFGAHMRPYLRVANVFEARIDLQDVMSMNFDPEEYEHFKLESGDILLNEGQTKELLGRPAIYRGELPGACFTNSLIRFRPFGDIAPEFALGVFRGYMRTGRFQQIGKITTNIAHLGAMRFRELEFPVPPLSEQVEIVRRLDRCLGDADDLVRRAAGWSKLLGTLNQSILAKAFRGELVPQDPNDEPAILLLDRIRHERSEQQSRQVRSRRHVPR